VADIPPNGNREAIVDASEFTYLDEARDYGAACSYNFRNAELRRLRDATAFRAVVVVEDEAGRYTLRGVGELAAWARGRNPHGCVV
jgi:hypothetical protein